MSAAAHPAEREIAQDLRLRSGKAPVARLSRKALIVICGVSGLAIAGAVGFGLMDHRRSGAPAATRMSGCPGTSRSRQRPGLSLAGLMPITASPQPRSSP